MSESIMVRTGPLVPGMLPPEMDEDEAESVFIEDDYVVTTAGSCFVQSIRIEADGTHVVTIAGRTEPPPDDAPVLVTYDPDGRCIARATQSPEVPR